MSELLLHPQTAAALERATKSQAHALMLVGPEGRGKHTAARELLRLKLNLESLDKLESYPYFLDVKDTKGSVSIDSIRELQRFLQLRTTGRSDLRRGVIIANAHTMTIEAQNALLKSLEEPPSDTVIILTASSTLGLKPTINSRVQRIEVLPVELASAEEYFSGQGISKEAIAKAYAISLGNAGLLAALLRESDEEHGLLQQIAIAKELLRLPLFDRLARADALAKDKDNLPLFLHGIRLVCSAGLAKAAEKSDRGATEQWVSKLKAIYRSEAALDHNPNNKLLMTDLLLNL